MDSDYVCIKENLFTLGRAFHRDGDRTQAICGNIASRSSALPRE